MNAAILIPLLALAAGPQVGPPPLDAVPVGRVNPLPPPPGDDDALPASIPGIITHAVDLLLRAY